MSDMLFLEKNIEERKDALLFLLYFLLVTRVKATSPASGVSTAISTSGAGIRTRSGPQILLIASTRVGISD